MIEVENLSKRYGDFTALDNVSFSARKGEIVGLLGPNGAGKTTTMRILTGFMPPSDGTARIAGADVVTQSMAARRAVGYLPERVPVYPDMTAVEFVTFWAQLRGVKRARQAADAALRRVHLNDQRDTLIRQLSKGMRQRLGLAQAMVHSPPVIILDEPTIGIDPQQVIDVRRSVRELGESHTVLFSTHILSEAEQVCDRVLIIDKGRLAAQGKPAELRLLLQPGVTLYVQLGGANKTQARELLSGLPGVASVDKDGVGFRVRGDGESDLRAAVFQTAAARGFSLLELRPVTTSLEDIFLQLVNTDTAREER